jgi:hypothetical protein
MVNAVTCEIRVAFHNTGFTSFMERTRINAIVIITYNNTQL